MIGYISNKALKNLKKQLEKVSFLVGRQSVLIHRECPSNPERHVPYEKCYILTKAEMARFFERAREEEISIHGIRTFKYETPQEALALTPLKVKPL